MSGRAGAIGRVIGRACGRGGRTARPAATKAVASEPVDIPAEIAGENVP
jgi:hypothetical protein